MRKERSTVDLWRFRRVRSDSAHAVADEVRSKLWSYLPGDKLPGPAELAKQMEVHPTFVDKGLVLLQSEGLLSSKGDQTYVQESSVGGPIHDLDRAARGRLQQEWSQVEAILDRRVEVESRAAYLAASNWGLTDCQNLASAVRYMQAASSRLREFLHGHEQLVPTAHQWGGRAAWQYRRQDWIFHLQLAELAGELELFDEVAMLRTRFFSYIGLTWYRWVNQQDSVREHDSIRLALQRRNRGGPSAAAKAMAKHIEATKDSLLRYVGTGAAV